MSSGDSGGGSSFRRQLVETTLPTRPFPPNSARAPIRTARLELRPLAPDDLAALHVLRTEPETMIFTARGRVDRDLAESRERLDRFLPPGDGETYNWAVRLAATGELVGLCGVHTADSHWFAWPELGYTLKREHWGRGLATEFLAAWLAAWWALPRSRARLEVHADSVDGGGDGDDGGHRTVEKLAAMVEVDNPGSRRVLEKNGFRHFTQWVEPDSRECFAGQDVTLNGFCLSRPR